MSTSPILTLLEKHEPLLLYIATTTMVVSTAMVMEQTKEVHVYKVQRPVYYISKVLSESKAKYPLVQKLLYALLITSCKLCHYFDEHKVTVVSDFPLGDVFYNRDATGCISKWSVELRA